MPDPQPSQKIEKNIVKEVASGIRSLGNDLSNTESEHLKSYLSRLRDGKFQRGWIFKQPSIKVENHEEFVQHVVGARKESGDFEDQFKEHLKKEGRTEEEAQLIFTKLFDHASKEYTDTIDKLRVQEEQARENYAKVQEKYAEHIENWQNGFEDKVDTHLEKNQEEFEGISEQELRMAKQLALQSLKVDELKEQLSKIPTPGKQEQEFAEIMEKKIAEQLKLMRTVNVKDPNTDKRFSEKNLAEKLKADVTSPITDSINKASYRLNARLEKTGKSLKEYFPTFTKWGQRAGVIGKESGKTAINVAATAGMISAELAKGSFNAVKKGAETFSNGFLDIMLALGILLHFIQWLTGGWQGPSPVAFKWAFIFLLLYFVFLLGADNDIKLRMKTFGFVCVFFVIEWQWFRIIDLLGIQTKWWALKALWPTLVWYWTIKSIMNPGKKTIMTRATIFMIFVFWVALGYSAINAGAYIEKYTPAGLSDEEYGQQKTGFMITLAEKLGYDVSEFEQAAAEKCRNDNGYYMDYYLDKGKVYILSSTISEGYRNCVEDNIVQLAQEKKEKNENERVIAAIKKETSSDFTAISFNEGKPRFEITPDPPKMIDSKKTIKSINTEVIYNIIYKTTFPDAEITFAAMLKKKGSNKEELTLIEGSPAMLRCLNIPRADCPDSEKSIEFKKSSFSRYRSVFESGVDISASNVAMPAASSTIDSIFVTGENTLRAAVIFTDRTKTTLPLIFATSDAIRDVKRTLEYDEESSKKNPKYEFKYWDQLVEINNLPIDISSTYRNSVIEGVYSEHPVVIDIKPLNSEKPIIELHENAITTWKTDIFNKHNEGKIVGINKIYLYLPAGMTPIADRCPFNRAEPKDIKEKDIVLKLAYELDSKYLAELQDPNKLIGLSDPKDMATTGIPTCSASIDQNRLFGRDTVNLNLKQKFINREIIIELEYTYVIFKDTKINIDYEIKPDLEVTAQQDTPVQQIDNLEEIDISISEPISGNAA